MKKFVICLCVFVFAGFAVSALAEDAKALRTQQAELKKSLMQVQKRLNLQKDPDMQALQQAVKDAQKAYQEGLNAKLKMDPEGAQILQQMEELAAQAKTAKPEKVRREKDGNKKKEGGGKKKAKKGQNDEDGEDAGQVEIFE